MNLTATQTGIQHSAFSVWTHFAYLCKSVRRLTPGCYGVQSLPRLQLYFIYFYYLQQWLPKILDKILAFWFLQNPHGTPQFFYLNKYNILHVYLYYSL
jgi:hypothetical protein